ncbi:cobalamin-binding protein [Kribbella lupini]|uniref:Cobalamin-binding protein n=1 Tax=Kribbella lupini TaxID=291602 RepID=A0ABP4MSD7_9ACTN
MKIVSLLPSATEICFALGAGDQVHGVTFECDHPAAARERRIVSATNLPAGLTPAEIDAAVRARVAAGEDLYKLDRDALRAIDPDLVITQDLCAVCAVDVDGVEEALSYLGCRAEVVTTDPHDLTEVLESIEQIAQAVGRPSEPLVGSLHRRLDALRALPPASSAAPRSAGRGGAGEEGAGEEGAAPHGVASPASDQSGSTPVTASASDQSGSAPVAAPASDQSGSAPVTSPASDGLPRVLVLEWTDPPFAPGHWIPEMVEVAGGVSVLGSAGLRSGRTTWPAVAAARPEVVVVAPCGFGLDDSARLGKDLIDQGLLPDVPVWAADANGYFARPGPRLVDGVEALAGILRGTAVDPEVARQIR